MNQSAATRPATAPYRYFGLLRLALAFLVMLQHAGTLLPRHAEAALLPLEIGGVAVFCFFVVSGFVIAEAIESFYENRPGAFLLNRLLRLTPTYIVALCLSAIVLAYAYPSFVPALNETPISPERFAASTVLVNLLALFPIWKLVQSHWHVPEILEQGWALRIEFMFYLVAAAGVLVAGLIRTSVASALTAVGVAALLGLALLGGRAEGTFLENTPYFVFGVALYYWLSHRSDRLLSGAFCLSACAFAAAHLLGRAATFGAAQVPRDRLGELVLLTVLTLALVILAIVPEARRRRWRLVVHLDRWFGELTYPLYLTHWCVLIAAKTWLPHERWASAICAFGAAFVLALLIVVVVERPVARLRALVRRRRAPVGGAEVTTTVA